jgi:DNA invertase Pin-like site-specific DNA recombinase
LIFNIFSALAQFERRLIQERTRAGLAVARSRGRRGGRPRLELEEGKVQAAQKLAADTEMPIDEICRILNISRSTHYRYIAMEPSEMEEQVE